MTSLALLHPDHDENPAFGTGERLKTTGSLCPTCLSRIDADVMARDGQVWMDKTCPDHGRYSALLASDRRHYHAYNDALDDVGGSCCGPGRHCGDQTANHSCNMLIEITQRCNLTCPTCYAGSSPERTEQMSYERFVELIDDLLEKGKGDADLIQLSGGEPTIHPDLFRMIEHALERGIQQVYVNTNGIKLAKRAFVEKLVPFKERLHVYLQLDGFDQKTLELLRGDGDLADKKIRALENLEHFGIDTVPVITLTPEVNDAELGRVLRRAAESPAVQSVMIQPAMYSGRYENPRKIERATLADVARWVAEQTGVFCDDDFTPIPCSDPNCFSMALAVRTSTGLVPVSRYLPRYDTWADAAVVEVINAVTDTFDKSASVEALTKLVLGSELMQALDEEAVDTLLDVVEAWQAEDAEGVGRGLFGIGVKPFMDAYTYDQDRIDKCCVHIISTDGTPVSFCEYNAINRPTGNL